MIDKRSKAASSPAQRTLIMKDTLSALVVYGRQEISSPAGFIYSVFVSYIFLYFTNYFTFTEFNIYILFNNLKIKPLSG